MTFWLLIVLTESREDLEVLGCNLPPSERVPSKTAGNGHGHPALTHIPWWLGAPCPRQPLMRKLFQAELQWPLWL